MDNIWYRCKAHPTNLEFSGYTHTCTHTQRQGSHYFPVLNIHLTLVPVCSCHEGLRFLSGGVLDFFWLEQLFPQKSRKFIMLEGQVFSICKYYYLVGLGEDLIIGKEK